MKLNKRTIGVGVLALALCLAALTRALIEPRSRSSELFTPGHSSTPSSSPPELVEADDFRATQDSSSAAPMPPVHDVRQSGDPRPLDEVSEQDYLDARTTYLRIKEVAFGSVDLNQNSLPYSTEGVTLLMSAGVEYVTRLMSDHSGKVDKQIITLLEADFPDLYAARIVMDDYLVRSGELERGQERLDAYVKRLKAAK